MLSCVHKSVEKCHYTYTTQFVPVTEEVIAKITSWPYFGVKLSCVCLMFA